MKPSKFLSAPPPGQFCVEINIYCIKIKIRVNSTITNTLVEINAANATIAKALAEQQYGKGNVLSVVKV